MRFAEWLLEEGWGIDLHNISVSGVDLPDLFLKMGDVGAAKYLSQKASLSYQAKRDPADLVRIQPLNRMQELPSLTPSNDVLPTFEGVKIYYAFSFVPQAEYNTGSMEKQRPTYVNDEMAAVARWINLLKTRTDIYQFIVGMINQNRRAEEIIDAVSKRFRIPEQNLYYLSRLMENGLGRKGANGDLGILRAEKILQGSERITQDGGLSKQFYRAITNAFAKAIKDPQDQRTTQVRDQIIRKSVDMFRRFFGDRRFDFVVYPQSSKEFNRLMAGYMAKQIGAVPKEGFSKLPKEEIGVDDKNMATLYRNPQRLSNRVAWLQRQIDKGYTQKGGLAIHRIDPELRKYVKLWKMNESFKNKRIVLIDDNVSTNATFQRLHDLLAADPPREVVIFSPLYMG